MLVHEGDFIDQRAKSPYEVLLNMNKYLTKVLAKHEVADIIMTVMRGMEVYAFWNRCAMEDVCVSQDIRPFANGLLLTMYHDESSTRTGHLSARRGSNGVQAFQLKKNEMYARAAMDEDIQRSIIKMLYCLDSVRAEISEIEDYEYEIDDLVVSDMFWVDRGRLFLELAHYLSDKDLDREAEAMASEMPQPDKPKVIYSWA